MAKGLFTSGDSVSRVMRLGSLLAIALGLFALLLAAILVYGSMQAQLVIEQASRAGDDKARDFSQALSSMQATLRDPQVQGFAREVIDLAGGSSDALIRAVRERGVTNILDLRAFPLTIEDIQFGEYPEPDFSVVEMLLEARRDGQATIQVHYPGTSNENLAFAQRIQDGNEPVGVLFMRLPLSALTSLLTDAGELSYLALVQGRGDRATVLRALGSSAGDRNHQSPIQGSRLALQWSRSTMVSPLGGKGTIILGAVGLILLMLGLVLRRRPGVTDSIDVAPRPKESKAPKAAQKAVAPPARPDRGSESAPLTMSMPESISADDSRNDSASVPAESSDLPDWLMDEERGARKDAPFEEPEDRPARDLPDLPDTLNEPIEEGPETVRDLSDYGEVDEEMSFDDDLASEPPAGELAEEFEPDAESGDEAEQLPETKTGPMGTKALDFDLDLDDDVEPEQVESEPEVEEDGEPEPDFEVEPESEAKPEPEPKPEVESEPELEPVPEPGPEPEPQPASDEKPAKSRPPLLDPALFRIGEISGVAEENMDARSATLIGQALGSEARERGIKRILVGRDGRLFGAVLLSALSQGIRSAGVDVIDAGPVPTPVLNAAAVDLADGSSVMVTGSHHGPEINGFRIWLAGEALHEDGIQALFRRIQDEDISSGQGSLEEQSTAERYVDRLSIDVQLERPLKVVVDCSNGIAGTVAPQALTGIGADVIPLYADVDGSFPNHHPDPANPENLEDLKLCVRNFQADLGIAFDGDGDRLGVVSADGEVVWPDQILMLLAKDILSRNSGGVVVHDVECSGRLNTLVKEAGGHSVVARSGEAFVAATMREKDAVLGGLMSGHYFISERWHVFDDAIYASARLLELLAADTRTFKEILAELPAAESTPEVRISVDSTEQADDLVMALIAEGSFDDGQMTTVDGLRIDFDDGWGVVRAAHTGPELVLRFEGEDAKALNRIKTLFKKQLKAQNPKLNLLF
jgi:phosphomannomutase / phosphoglucomutase